MTSQAPVVVHYVVFRIATWVIVAAVLASVLVFVYDAWSVASGHHLALVTLVVWPLWVAATIGGLLWLGLRPSRLRRRHASRGRTEVA